MLASGSGAFSNVYKAIDRQTGLKVAVKVVRKYELNQTQVGPFLFSCLSLPCSSLFSSARSLSLDRVSAVVEEPTSALGADNACLKRPIASHTRVVPGVPEVS